MVTTLHHPTTEHSGFWLVQASGELDIGTLPDLERELFQALSISPPPSTPLLVLDLLPVTFLDCAAVRLLHRTRAAVLGRGGWFSLVHAERPTGLLLRRLRLQHLFPAYESVGDAVRAASVPSCGSPPCGGGTGGSAPTMTYERNTG
ncbi:STAS domain-containing protein [Streptomyces sp. NPDC048172]|uniref:STAS domain-containing protein n=1 Tax=Streptomyces sp. NPDC048172 TaxID=3365505 RepID=UPI00371816E7